MYKLKSRALKVSAMVLTLSAMLVGGAMAGVPELTPELEKAFEQAGWDARRAGDGSLILRHAGSDAAAAEHSEQKAAGSVGAAENAMWERLRGMGWRVETDAEGATLLYPPVKKQAAAKKKAVGPKGGDTTAKDKTLDQVLEERGWRVERDSDGTMTLYPQAVEAEPEQQENKVIEPAQGYVPTEEESGVELPVNKWSEAKRMAESWIQVFGSGELKVGKIRKVLRVYLVSIVESKSPYALQHQIAINTSDGRVVVLN